MGLVKPARGWRVTDDAWDDIYRGLEGLWLMNDGSGTVVADASGHGRHGTAVNGPTWVAGDAGWYGNFAAKNACYILPSALHTILVPTGYWTMAVRCATTQIASGYAVAFTNSNAIQASISVYAFSDTYTGLFVSGSSGVSCKTTTDINDGKMCTLVGTNANKAMTIYHNGSVAATATAGTYVSGIDLRIGCRNPGETDWDGTIDYAAIWSRALSAQEVRRLHEQPPWMVG